MTGDVSQDVDGGYLLSKGISADFHGLFNIFS